MSTANEHTHMSTLGPRLRREPIFNVPAAVVVALAVLGLVHAAMSQLTDIDDEHLIWVLAFVPARYTGWADQVPGGQLGYEVLEFAPDADDAAASPNFEAYPIHLGGAGESFDIRLTSGDGASVPGSDRLVRVPEDPPLSRLLLVPIVPLGLGALLITRRLRRVKPPDSVTG